jgi:hypothetical protein
MFLGRRTPKIITQTISQMMRQVVYKVHVRDEKLLKGNDVLEDLKSRWEDNIKIDLSQWVTGNGMDLSGSGGRPYGGLLRIRNEARRSTKGA